MRKTKGNQQGVTADLTADLSKQNETNDDEEETGLIDLQHGATKCILSNRKQSKSLLVIVVVVVVGGGGVLILRGVLVVADVSVGIFA